MEIQLCMTIGDRFKVRIVRVLDLSSVFVGVEVERFGFPLKLPEGVVVDHESGPRRLPLPI